MKSRTVLLVALFVVVAIWVIGLGCWPVVLWSPLNCLHEDVDINSGRVRQQRYLLGLCIHEVIEETSLSRLIETDGKYVDWRRVNTFSPMVRHSPHYHYHGAIHQISMLDLIWHSGLFTPAAKVQMASDVLALWHVGEGYLPVTDYLGEAESVCDKRLSSGEPIEVKDLPTVDSIKARRKSKRRERGT